METEDIKIVALRGLAGSGKDTIADYLAAKSGVDVLYYAEPLHLIAMESCGIDYDTWWDWYENDKESAREELGGLSCRQLITNIAEDYLKPTFGSEHMAKLLHDRMDKDLWKTNISIIKDLGFIEELNYTANKVGVDNVLVVDIKRDVEGSEDDVRSVDFDPSTFGVKHLKVDNNGSVADAGEQILNTLHDMRWINYE